MGGALTQLYTLEKSTELRGIILVGTGARLRVNPMIFNLLENDFEGYVNAVGEFMFHSDTDETIKEASKAEVRKCPASIIHKDFGFCNEFDIMENVSDINLPALVIVGENDVMTPTKYSKFLVDRIKGSQMHIVPNAGHSVMLEQWEFFNDIAVKWYQNL
jgi:pimeloyl-ACP methyl ester carboxylesterase